MKIICIGRNYVEHIKELNNTVTKDAVLFIKPDSAILKNTEAFFIPSFSNDVHYECEIAVRIHKLGKNIGEKFAHRYYNQISLGLDFTARDLQQKLKDKGLPWEKAKAFDNAAVIGTWQPVSDYPNLQDLTFRLEKNGAIVQSGNSSQMMRSIDQLIAEISNYFTLKIGDIILTGTPAGVGPVKEGDVLKGYLEDRLVLETPIK